MTRLFYHGHAMCSSPLPASPEDAIADARRMVLKRLEGTSVPSEKALHYLKLSMKGARISARITLADDSMVLPALLPILREFPEIRWASQTDSSIIGDTLVLESAQGTGKGSISVVMPRLDRSNRAAAFETSELELFCGSSMSELEASALANSIAVVYTTTEWKRQRQPPDDRALLHSFGDFLGRRVGDRLNDPSSSRGSSDPFARLETLGVSVYRQKESDGHDWDALAGGERVRATLEDSLLLPMQRPEIYEEVMKGTRAKNRTPHTKSILFEGPPGTGKTSTARILASKLGQPMVYLPLESVVSKWYGEAEQKLAAIFDACAEVGSMVIFLDEIDALATSRDDAGMHEASRRSLSVLLRKLDGFEANQSTVLIAATNRPQDLDPALLSRFELAVSFPLPEVSAREKIFSLYAKHLDPSEVQHLASLSDGISGRDIRDVCEAAERQWAANRVRQKPETLGVPLPPAQLYEQCLLQRKGTHDEYLQRRFRDRGGR